jgi:hypothetical protein
MLYSVLMVIGTLEFVLFKNTGPWYLSLLNFVVGFSESLLTNSMLYEFLETKRVSRHEKELTIGLLVLLRTLANVTCTWVIETFVR